MFNVKIIDKALILEKTLQVAPTTTGLELQNQVISSFSISSSTSVLLYFQGKKLGDRATLQAEGVISDSTIQVMYRVGGKTVNVVIPDGAMRRVVVEDGETVGSLVARLGYKVGRDRNAALSFNDAPLEESELISNLHLADGDVLHLTTEIQGGNFAKL